jgi:hypothetical protein
VSEIGVASPVAIGGTLLETFADMLAAMFDFHREQDGIALLRVACDQCNAGGFRARIEAQFDWMHVAGVGNEHADGERCAAHDACLVVAQEEACGTRCAGHERLAVHALHQDARLMLWRIS